MKLNPSIDKEKFLDQVLEAVKADDYLGLCLNCGSEQGGCEPDARAYKCESCSMRAVYGAEECLLMLT